LLFSLDNEHKGKAPFPLFGYKLRLNVGLYQCVIIDNNPVLPEDSDNSLLQLGNSDVCCSLFFLGNPENKVLLVQVNAL
jgi:hypothetical protein